MSGIEGVKSAAAQRIPLGPDVTSQSGHWLGGWLDASYGRLVFDLVEGWRTERLDLEPLSVAHAAELGQLLYDRALHEFTGGAPLGGAALAARYALLATRRSPGGDQLWGNRVMRPPDRPDLEAVPDRASLRHPRS